jgi:transcription initiation factor IIE alpha subunit
VFDKDAQFEETCPHCGSSFVRSLRALEGHPSAVCPVCGALVDGRDSLAEIRKAERRLEDFQRRLGVVRLTLASRARIH